MPAFFFFLLTNLRTQYRPGAVAPMPGRAQFDTHDPASWSRRAEEPDATARRARATVLALWSGWFPWSRPAFGALPVALNCWRGARTSDSWF
jgi:hypothetical protein